ncbi:hypothetical protein PCE1_003129 [Barthelona sp. PCE]
MSDQNPMEINGGAMMAMTGKSCIAIGYDSKIGNNAEFLGKDFERVFRINDECYYGLAGMASDVQTLHSTMKFHSNLYKMKEKRDMDVEAFTHMLSHEQYIKRWSPFYVEGIIAGFDKDGKPRVYGTDIIGDITEPHDFIVAGTCEENLMGMAETFWRPDLEEEELMHAVAHAMQGALNRDAISGWKLHVTVVTKEHVRTVVLRSRQD